MEEEAISPSIRQSNTRQKNQLKITRSKNGSKMNIQITLRPSTTKTSLGDTTRTAARLTMSPSEVGIIKEEAKSLSVSRMSLSLVSSMITLPKLKLLGS